MALNFTKDFQNNDSICFKHRYQGNIITQFCTRTIQEVFGAAGLIDLILKPCEWTLEEQQQYEQQTAVATEIRHESFLESNSEVQLIAELPVDDCEHDYEYEYEYEYDEFDDTENVDSDIEEA